MRGVSPRLVDDREFATLDEAYHGVFMRRVHDLMESLKHGRSKRKPARTVRRSGRDVRDMFDRMTRTYLLTVVGDDLIEEHRRSPTGHHSEPLARLLAWCQRRPLRSNMR